MTRAAALAFGVALACLCAAARAAEAAHEAGSTFSDCDGCPELVVVPPGRFVMGTPGAQAERGAAAAEGRPVLVEIPRAFALGRREVTRGEYARFISDSGHEPRAGCRVWDPDLARFSDDTRRGWQDIATPAAPADDLPASCVSFADALAYVQWLSAKTGERYRLPSEAEWEYAARAGSMALRPWGDEAEGACEFGNTYDLVGAAQYRLGWMQAGCRDGYADLAPVGQFEANAFGLQDMIGNVREWVQDCATGSYVGRPRDARAWEWIGGCAERVQRGGSWLTPASESRSAWRGSAPAGESAADAGLRVARDIAGRAREER
jgi:formylglycine-generating enzyme required for sulfatase activity